MKAKLWSEEDIKLLSELYPQRDIHYEDIEEKLGRNWHTIKYKARRLQLKRPHPIRLHLDNSLIKELYCDEKLGTTEIAEHFNCSKLPIQSRLRKMGCLRSFSEAQKLSYATGGKSQRGELNPSWKGGRAVCSSGYIMMLKPDYHRANKRGYVMEHILVWEEAHGKPLPEGWVIHHINGIKSDNRPQNLLALSGNAKHSLIIPKLKQKIRELEIDNRQLRKAFEDSQMILYMNEN